MPIYIDTNTGVKYAYSTIGQLDDPETADVISSPSVIGDIIILSTFNLNGRDYIVNSIGHNAFRGCTGLRSVTIPDTVTSIGDYAFGSCSSLVTVDIPNSIKSIGYYAFGSCGRLSTIVIPNSVATIGPSAFYYCTSLATVVISDAITIIEPNTFVCCPSLISVNIPDSVTSIGTNAFAYCGRLPTVIIPVNVTNIGANAFSHCTRLSSIIIPNKVISIGINAFNSCVRLTSVTFTNVSITIERGAFDEIACPSIAYVPPGFNDIQIANLRLNFSSIITIYTPTISHITPTKGSNTVPTKVTITGTFLNNVTTVLFGSNNSTNIAVVSNEIIEVLAPTRIDTGLVNVKLITSEGNSVTLTNGYEYTVKLLLRRFVGINILKWGRNQIRNYIKLIWNSGALVDRSSTSSSE